MAKFNIQNITNSLKKHTMVIRTVLKFRIPGQRDFSFIENLNKYSVSEVIIQIKFAQLNAVFYVLIIFKLLHGCIDGIYNKHMQKMQFYYAFSLTIYLTKFQLRCLNLL